LRADGGRDIGGREVDAQQFGRVDPDAHGTLGAKQLGLADARQTLYFGHDAA